jgi:hypothetical protein
MLTEEEISEFKRIYEEEFGLNISDKEARDRAIEIATYFEIAAEIFENGINDPKSPS